MTSPSLPPTTTDDKPAADARPGIQEAAARETNTAGPALEGAAADASEPPPAPPPAEQAAASDAPSLSPAACADRLAELFPALFAGPPRPIKLRIQADIQQRAPGLFTRRLLSAVLGRHTTTTAYLRALVEQGQRYDLDGQPAGEVSAEHRQAATEELTRRRHIAERRRAEWRAARMRDPESREAGAAGEPRRPIPSSGPRKGEAARAHGPAGQRPTRAERQARPRPVGGTSRPSTAAPVRARAPLDASRAPVDAAQRERAQLLRAWESTSLSKANFCTLKRLDEAEFDAQIELARRERAAPGGS